MKPEDLEYVKHKLARSQETLGEAKHLFEGGFVRGVVNRIYYACFYAVSALLLCEGRSRSKHSGVMSLFDELWIKPGRLPAEVGAFYHLIFDRRQKGDYEDVSTFGRADVESWLKQGGEFINQISAALRETIGSDVD